MNMQRALAPLTAPLGWRSAVLLLAVMTAVWQLAVPIELPVSAPLPSPPAATPPAAASVAAVSSAYPAIAEHPLFFPTRQPWAPPVPKAAPPVPPAPVPAAAHPLKKYQLVGVMISEGARTALIMPSDGGKTVFISEGQQLNGWTLREITREALHFESGDAAYDLKFPTPRWPRN